MFRKLYAWMLEHRTGILTVSCLLDFFLALHSSYGHSIGLVLLWTAVIAIQLVLIHMKPYPPRDDDRSENGEPDTPFGDTIDHWLRSKHKVTV